MLWVILLLLNGATGQFVNDIHPLLRNDGPFHGPGVLSRVTPTGTNYVARIVTEAFVAHFSDIATSANLKNRVLPTLSSLSLTNITLSSISVDDSSIQTSTASGLYKVTVGNAVATISALPNGTIQGTSISGPVAIKSAGIAIFANIRIGRNSNGNPSLKLHSCDVRAPTGISLTAQKVLEPKLGKIFAEAVAKDAHDLFEHMICPKIDVIITSRVNQRFSLLSSKITLEQTKDFDVAKNILNAEERLRMVRQNSQRKFMDDVGSRVNSFLAQRRHVIPRQVHDGHRHPIEVRRAAAASRLMLRAPRALVANRMKRQAKANLLLNSFDLSKANSLMLDFGMVSTPILNAKGIELMTSGEVYTRGNSTPFGARPMALPAVPSTSMLQIAVSDFVPNSLMYHGHRMNLFQTRIDWKTPQIGPMMRTSCDISTGSLFCIGDLFPTVRELMPGHNLAFLFNTITAPALIFSDENRGGIRFSLWGLINLVTEAGNTIGAMEIKIEAKMKMKLTSKSVKGKVSVEDIRFITRSPQMLLQEELDDAGFLSREILQRMVNDILKQGIPIPVHPLFKIVKPKLTLYERTMLLETDFDLNPRIIRQLTAERLA